MSIAEDFVYPGKRYCFSGVTCFTLHTKLLRDTAGVINYRAIFYPFSLITALLFSNHISNSNCYDYGTGFDALL